MAEQKNEIAVFGGNYDYETRIAKMSPEEKQSCLVLANSIDVNDISTVRNYGSALSKVVSRNGSTLLESVKCDSTSEVVELTNELMSQLKVIDIDELNSKNRWKKFIRSVPVIRKMVTSVENIFEQYETVSSRVSAISDKIATTKMVALRDNSTLQQIFESNVSYIEQCRKLIMAAKLKVEEIGEQIVNMQENPNDYEAYQVNDMMNFKNALERKIADMQTTEYILTQNLFQIRATQSNNNAIAEKADNIVNNIIPIWKNQLSLNIIMNNQSNSVEAQQKITDTTNKILRKNSEMLKINSVNVAKSNEEAIVNVETLKETTKNLIDTINEVHHIHDEGTKKRLEIEKELSEFGLQLESSINNLQIEGR